ncbi:MAG TPA: hypothetical protein IAA80_02655 [Candidatus Gallacutalibacter pullistercoris]|nr:hypothetical protein [Candidatus Gallacutalibacter pullistercoris]
MLIFWQECKHILRSCFFWCVVIIAISFSVFVYGRYYSDGFSEAYHFTEENGTSFTEEDALAYVQYCLEHTDYGERLKENLRGIGIEDVTGEEILAYHKGEETELEKKLEKFGEKAISENEQLLYSNAKYYLSVFEGPFVLVETGNFENNEDRILDREESFRYMEEAMPKWKVDLLRDGYERLDERVDEIVKNGENHHFFPYPIYVSSGNSNWFNSQFTQMSVMGFLWMFSFVLAGMAAARSLGGSLMSNMQGMVYTGKNGRRVILHKLMAVLVVTGGTYLILYLLSTIVYLVLFRLDLYWNVPLAALTDWNGPVIPRFAITIGGYWWFQLGVSLATVLIMALIFSAAMVLTKNFYAGSAISVGVSLLLYGLIQMVPGMQNSLLLMGSPIGLFLNAGAFLQDRLCKFYILPHFEGISLLIWIGMAAILAMLGFVRFRKAAL